MKNKLEVVVIHGDGDKSHRHHHHPIQYILLIETKDKVWGGKHGGNSYP